MSVRLARPFALAATCALATVVLAGCVPEPAPTASTAPPTASPTLDTTPMPSPSPTAAAFAVPESCEQLYSPQMLAILQAEVPPLNDPGVTMLSTQNVDAIEVIDAAGSQLRCTWGPPSERGIATTVVPVTPEQADAVIAALSGVGFSVEPYAEGTVLRIAQETITLDDELVAMGETHFLGDGGWVATRWINVDPEGYTEDIVATLWDSGAATG